MLWIAALAIIAGVIIVFWASDYGMRHPSKDEQQRADAYAAVGVGVFIAGVVDLAWWAVLFLKLW